MMRYPEGTQLYYTDGINLFNIPCTVSRVVGDEAIIQVNLCDLGSSHNQQIEMTVPRGRVSPYPTAVAIKVDAGLVDGLFPKKHPTIKQIDAMVHVLANLISRRGMYLIDECMTELERHGFSQFEEEA